MYVIPPSSFHLAVCSCLTSSSIFVFSTPILSRISGVGICLRSWARSLNFLFDVPIETRIVVPVGICVLFASVIVVLKCCAARSLLL